MELRAWSVSRDSFLALGIGWLLHPQNQSRSRHLLSAVEGQLLPDVEELQNARTVYASAGFAPALAGAARALHLEIVDRYIQSAFFSIREDL